MRDPAAPKGNVRICVVMPTRGEVQIETFRSVMKTFWHVATTPLADGRKIEDFQMQDATGSHMMQSRYDLVKRSQEIGGFSHLLFLDDDISFPHDAIHRMLDRRKQIVAANYVMKSAPNAFPTARVADPEHPFGRYLPTRPEDKGLVEASLIGFGLCLIETGVFRLLPEPWFGMPWTAGRGKGTRDHFQGEDATFCNLCRDVKIPIYVDHDVSQQVEHIGRFSYKNEYSYVV